MDRTRQRHRHDVVELRHQRLHRIVLDNAFEGTILRQVDLQAKIGGNRLNALQECQENIHKSVVLIRRLPKADFLLIEVRKQIHHIAHLTLEHVRIEEAEQEAKYHVLHQKRLKVVEGQRVGHEGVDGVDLDHEAEHALSDCVPFFDWRENAIYVRTDDKVVDVLVELYRRIVNVVCLDEFGRWRLIIRPRRVVMAHLHSVLRLRW